MYKLIIALSIAVVACCLSSCGGSAADTGSDRDQAAVSITKPQFIQKAGTICAHMAADQEDALTAWSKSFSGGPKEEQQRFKHEYGQVVVPFMRRLAKELEGLGAPEGDQAAVTAMVDGLHKTIRALEQRDPAEVKQYLLYTFKRAAFAYGLKTCPAL
jgi:hypothetical protein